MPNNAIEQKEHKRPDLSNNSSGAKEYKSSDQNPELKNFMPVLDTTEPVSTFGIGRLYPLEQDQRRTQSRLFLRRAVELFDNKDEDHKDDVEILMQIGGPLTAKTVRSSEMANTLVNVLQKSFDQSKPGDSEVDKRKSAEEARKEAFQRVVYIEFEDAIAYAKQYGIIDEDQPIGTFSADDYKNIFNPILESMVYNAIDSDIKGSRKKIIILEMPNTAKRGNAYNILTHQDQFRELKYHVNVSAYTHGAGLLEKAIEQDRNYPGDNIVDKAIHYRDSGTNIIFNPQGRIGGGNTFAVRRFYQDESTEMYKFIHDILTANSDITTKFLDKQLLEKLENDQHFSKEYGQELPDYIYSNGADVLKDSKIRSLFMEYLWFPFMLKYVYQLPEEDVFIGRTTLLTDTRLLLNDWLLDELRFMNNYDNPEKFYTFSDYEDDYDN